MNWRFTLIDYTVNPSGDTIVLDDEPIGWSEIVLKIKRGLLSTGERTHGVIFEASVNKLGFINKGFEVLNNAYNTNGTDAVVELLIEYKCSDSDSYELFYKGRIDFSSVEIEQKDACIFSVAVEQKGCLPTLRNRWDQKVDLDSLNAFDGTALTPYNYLGVDFRLESKEILLKTEADTPTPFSESETIPINQLNHFYYIVGFDNITLSEVKDSYLTYQFSFGTNAFSTIVGSLTPTIESKEIAGIRCMPITYDIEIDLSGTFTELSNDGNRTYTFNIFFNHYNKNDTLIAGYSLLSTPYPLITAGTPNIINFSISQSLSITLSEGDKLFLVISLSNYLFLTGPPGGSGVVQSECTFSASSYKMRGLSICEPTVAKVYFVNEALSRVAEAITGDCMRVYSDYYGRPDAQPYPSASLGCGSERVLTNGLKIRRIKMADGTEPKMWLSLKDMISSLNAIDNIGIGIEPDPNRPGYELLRVEPVDYWYQDTLIHTCDEVKEIKITTENSLIYSLVSIGYQKWESEFFNGLDEFLTKRHYRTELGSVKNSLNQLSQFIASGYAIEVTRREAQSTKDFKYDNDIFIICVKKVGIVYVVDLGIDDPANLIGPDTIYNARISPARNAFRWFRSVAASWAWQFAAYNRYMIMTEAEGNYIAEMMLRHGNDCDYYQLALAENLSIGKVIFADINNAKPLWYPESIEFEYPLSVEQFKTIRNNPRGYIRATQRGKTYDGWIDEVDYEPNSGLAKFKLIRKY